MLENKIIPLIFHILQKEAAAVQKQIFIVCGEENMYSLGWSVMKWFSTHDFTPLYTPPLLPWWWVSYPVRSEMNCSARTSSSHCRGQNMCLCAPGGSAPARHVPALPAVVSPWGHPGVQGRRAHVWSWILWRGGRGGRRGRRWGGDRNIRTGSFFFLFFSASTQQQLQGPVDQGHLSYSLMKTGSTTLNSVPCTLYYFYI